MSFKTLAEYVDQARSEIQVLVPGSDSLLRRSVFGVFATIFGSLAYGLQTLIKWAMRQQFAATADNQYLDTIGEEVGVYRIHAKAFIGTVSINGGGSGAVVPAGTTLQRSDGYTYVTQSSVMLTGASNSVIIVASSAGSDGNAASGTVLTPTSTIAGIISIAVSGVSVYGNDEESDDDYRDRILLHKRTPSGSGTIADWEKWVSDFSSQITRVKITPNYGGSFGVVGILALTDDSGTIPSASFIASLQSYADSIAPIGATPLVITPTFQTISLTASVVPNTATVRAAATAEIEDYISNYGLGGSTVTLDGLKAAAMFGDGVTKFSISSPASDISLAGDKVAQLGSITWV